MDESKFLRSKTTAIYESDTSVVDKSTGEILRQERAVKKKVSAEPDYIKVYYQAMMAVNDISSSIGLFTCSVGSVRLCERR